MPIEKQPLSLVPKNYVPPNSKPYRVKDGDSWITVARANAMDTWDLIFFNFKTRDPAQVNWYLRNYVGCNRATADGKNWMFSSSANPGIIYIPVTGHVPSKLSKVWVGLGKSHSGDLLFVGAHDLTAKIYNCGDDIKNVRSAIINWNGWTLCTDGGIEGKWNFGGGLGGSIGAVLVVANGYINASDINGIKGEWSLDIAAYSRLNVWLEAVKPLGKIIDTLDKLNQIKDITQSILSILNNKTGIYTFPIPGPTSYGMHLSRMFKFGDVKVVNSSIGFP